MPSCSRLWLSSSLLLLLLLLLWCVHERLWLSMLLWLRSVHGPTSSLLHVVRIPILGCLRRPLPDARPRQVGLCWNGMARRPVGWPGRR